MIVATNSKVRRDVIEQLVANSTVHFLILEKVLFVNKEDYKLVANILIKNNIRA